MNVKELFSRADPERVFYGYTLLRPVFDDIESIPIEEQTGMYIRLKKHIYDTCERIGNCQIETGEAHTVFVMNRTSLEYGQSYKSSIECRLIVDKDALEAVNKDFSIWDDEGEVRLNFYSLDFTSTPEIARYTVASKSIEHMGINTCCAAILYDLFTWGFTDEDREKKQKEIIESLAESERDIEEGWYYTAEEVFEELKKELFSDCSEDEKEHIIREDQYKESVKEIEERYVRKILEKDHKDFIDAVRTEYSHSWRRSARQ